MSLTFGEQLEHTGRLGLLILSILLVSSSQPFR